MEAQETETTYQAFAPTETEKAWPYPAPAITYKEVMSMVDPRALPEKSKALRPPGSHVSGTKGIEITPEAENPVSRPGAGLVASAGTITGDEEAPNAP